MIFLLHGGNLVASRQKLNDLIDNAKKSQKEIIRLEGKVVSLAELKQSLESQSLFGQEKLVVLEGIFSYQKSKEKEDIIKYLKTEKISCEFVLWEAKAIDGRSLRNFPKDWQFLLFKTPVVIFKFLDSIRPKNQRQMLALIQRSIRVDSEQMVFYMLASRVRQLILASYLGKKGLKGAPWQIGKLVHQAKNFSQDQLIKIYQKMLKIDTDIKTGKSIMPLDWHLDLLITSL